MTRARGYVAPYKITLISSVIAILRSYYVALTQTERSRAGYWLCSTGIHVGYAQTAASLPVSLVGKNLGSAVHPLFGPGLGPGWVRLLREGAWLHQMRPRSLVQYAVLLRLSTGLCTGVDCAGDPGATSSSLLAPLGASSRMVPAAGLARDDGRGSGRGFIPEGWFEKVKCEMSYKRGAYLHRRPSKRRRGLRVTMADGSLPP